MKHRLTLTSLMLLVALVFSFMPVNGLSLERAAAAPSCNWAQFVTDVTVPDGTYLAPGTTFTKTWRLKNIAAAHGRPPMPWSFHRAMRWAGLRL